MGVGRGIRKFLGELVLEVVGGTVVCLLILGVLLGIASLGRAAYAASPVGTAVAGVLLVAVAGYGGVEYARGPRDGARRGRLAAAAVAVFGTLAVLAGLAMYCGCVWWAW